ncbi:MAG TPA: hypothetical protein VNW28_09415, partial [Chthoniobacterales bacterium]|nr:hypothetical protein [Chthoniobacterales bacterium]
RRLSKANSRCQAGRGEESEEQIAIHFFLIITGSRPAETAEINPFTGGPVKHSGIALRCANK